MLNYLLQDVRYALRGMRGSPGFTLVAVMTLALGIGVNATVFTVTNAVLFKGFPLVKENDRLVYVSGGNCCVSYPDFEDYRALAKSFEGMAIVHGISIALNDANGFAKRISGNENSADTFRLAGQRPLIGRDFTEADEMPGAAPVAILNYGFWERRYAKDPSLLGKTVRMNGRLTTVIGVMPQGFSFPQAVEVWTPLVKTADVLKRENRDTWFAFGRLAKGATFETARAEIETIGKRNAATYPLTNHDFQPVVSRFHEFFIGPNAVMIYGSMWGAVGFVLLIACANLANLLLARAMGRSREISVRIALGAGRWQIIRQLLVESLMLSMLGGSLGWWIAKWSVHGYQFAMASKASWLILDYSMDYRVFGYLVAISIGTGILFGLAPALRLSRLDVNSALKDGGRGSTGGRGPRLSTLLVTGEMALAVVLLAGAGVMIRSFLKIHNADLGIDADKVAVAALNLPSSRYPSAASLISFHDRLLARLGAVPGVESVAIASALPGGGADPTPFEIAGAPADDLQRPSIPAALAITPAYFRTLGASLLSGREFSDSDGPRGVPVALVNRLFASKYWPGEDPLGKRLRLFDRTTPGPWLTVVGVVSNIMEGDPTRQKFNPVVYLPYRQESRNAVWILARTLVAPTSLGAALPHAVQEVDAELPMFGPYSLVSRLEIHSDTRFYGSLFLIFAAIALLLASVGLYAVIAHSVSLRTHELGIRIAIGATPRDIVGLIFRQGMMPMGIGLIVGLASSLPVNRLLQSMTVSVSPSDPITLAATSGVLILSATLGCAIPAWRAMRVDPVVALRCE